jgi:hypothetical protein
MKENKEKVIIVIIEITRMSVHELTLLTKDK